MKRVLLAILIVILGLSVSAQEICFSSSVVSAAGSSSDYNLVTFSKWRIGQIHILTLPDSKLEGAIDPGLKITAFPNPVLDILYLEFELSDCKEFFLKIFDTSGRLILQKDARPFWDGDVENLDLSKYPPALYLLQVSSSDLQTQKILHIQKQ